MQILMLRWMEAGASLAEACEHVAADEVAHPDWDMFEARTYAEWLDAT